MLPIFEIKRPILPTNILYQWIGFIFLYALIAQVGIFSDAFARDKSLSKKDFREIRLSLHEAMKASVNENPDVKLFREKIRQAEDQAFTQLGELLPNISGRMSASRRRFFLSSFGGAPGVSSPRDFYEARITLTQNIFSLSLIEKWRASRMNVKVSNLDSETKKMDTMAIVGLSYLETLRARGGVKARMADVRLNKELLRLAIERKSAGMATSLDVTRARVQSQNQKQHLLVARNAYDRSKLNLIRQIGLPFDVKLFLTDKLKLVEVSMQTVEEALQVASENRVELRAQKQRKRLAELSLSSVNMERIPSLIGSADVGMIGNQIPDALTTDNVQLLLSIPIFDGGQREGRISENRSLVRQEDIRIRDMEYQIALEVRDALLAIESAKKQVAVARESLRLTLQELNLARQRFAVGIATNIEITEAQTRVVKARDSFVDSLFKFNASRLNLARAQGQLQTLEAG